jgi:hypothetical protein
VRLPESDEDKKGGGGKNFCSPTGSYFLSVRRVGTQEWLGPEDTLSEGSELYQRYAGNNALNGGLLQGASMLVRLKGLVAAGFDKWSKWVKKGKAPDNLKTWFRLARRMDTPLPDFSQEYDSDLGLVNLKLK